MTVGGARVPAPVQPRVLNWAGFRRHVADLPRAIAFYRDGLGFRVEDAPVSTGPRRARLRLGGQSIDLIENGAIAPSDRYARGVIDTRFQHLAIVAGEMTSAWERLQRCRPVAISHGGPVQLPASAGGVRAVKFLDPDGHPLELIQFPVGSGPAVWQGLDSEGPTLGIDHSAIVVADVDRSIAFYRDALGFTVAARQVNDGPTQAQLDGIDAVVVDVVALRPASEETPHLELLGYRASALQGVPVVVYPDCLVWCSDDPSALAARRAQPFWRLQRSDGQDLTLCDPDDHRHRIIGPVVGKTEDCPAQPW